MLMNGTKKLMAGEAFTTCYTGIGLNDLNQLDLSRNHNMTGLMNVIAEYAK